jgi:hypothetical protein
MAVKAGEPDLNRVTEGKVHHVELGTYIFGDRVDRLGARRDRRSRTLNGHRMDLVRCVSCAIPDQPGRPAISRPSRLNATQVAAITNRTARRKRMLLTGCFCCC